MSAGDLPDLLGWLDGHVNLEASMPGRAGAPTLERIRAICHVLGDPERAYPVIHVTGTNGKGSTVRMATELLRTKGLKVGTYTSPNLERVNERICIDAEPIADEDFAEVLDSLRRIEETLRGPATRFELLTAAGFMAFADAAVEVAVVEVGLGGLWDATNVVDPLVAAVTNVSYDHVEILGPTLEDISREKAGILKPGCRPVLGETSERLLAIFEDAASRVGTLEPWLRDRDFACERNRVAMGGRLVDLAVPGARYEDVFLSLHGSHQGENAACALAAVTGFFEDAPSASIVHEALGSLRIPGRMEIMDRSPLTLLDGAHNVAGMEALAGSISEELLVQGPKVAVVGMLGGRDPSAMLGALGHCGLSRVVACEPPSPRRIPAAEVAEAGASLGMEVEASPGVSAAIDRARDLAGADGMVLVTGSLYVVAEARKVLSASGARAQ